MKINRNDFIKFSIASTLASTMTWWLSFTIIDIYHKTPNSKEIVLGIAIAFTVLYYVIAFFKMTDFEQHKPNMEYNNE